MNAFKIKTKVKVNAAGELDPNGKQVDLKDLPMPQKCAAVYKQANFAMKLPLMLAAAFTPNLLSAAMIDKSAAPKAPSFEQFKSFAHREFFGGEAKYATEAANPILTTATGLMEEWYHELPYFDFGYLASFTRINLIGSNQDSFKMNTTSVGVTWTQRNPGDRTLVRREFAEGEATVGMLEFTAAIGILDVWLQFNQFYRVEEVINEFIVAAHVKRSSLHYALITATTNEEAFATDDATTYNNACSTMIQACKSKGYGFGANPVIDLYVDTKRAGRVLAMLEATRGSLSVGYGTQDQPIVLSPRNIVITPTLSTSGTGYYLVLPGGKLKTADWLAMQIESKRDITVSATDWHGKEQYNCASGDANQIIRAKFS